jgi:hypothetical protein
MLFIPVITRLGGLVCVISTFESVNRQVHFTDLFRKKDLLDFLTLYVGDENTRKTTAKRNHTKASFIWFTSSRKIIIVGSGCFFLLETNL